MARLDDPRTPEWYMKNLTPVTRALYLTRTVRLHTDGDTIGLVLRWWHPMAWVTFVLVVIGTFCACGFSGVKDVLTNDINFYVTSRYYRKHPEELKWL